MTKILVASCQNSDLFDYYDSHNRFSVLSPFQAVNRKRLTRK
jgi:hypothetical protein